MWRVEQRFDDFWRFWCEHWARCRQVREDRRRRRGNLCVQTKSERKRSAIRPCVSPRKKFEHIWMGSKQKGDWDRNRMSGEATNGKTWIQWKSRSRKERQSIANSNRTLTEKPERKTVLKVIRILKNISASKFYAKQKLDSKLIPKWSYRPDPMAGCKCICRKIAPKNCSLRYAAVNLANKICAEIENRSRFQCRVYGRQMCASFPRIWRKSALRKIILIDFADTRRENGVKFFRESRWKLVRFFRG